MLRKKINDDQRTKWNFKKDSSPLTIFWRWFGMIVKRHARFGNTYDGYIRISVSWKFRLRMKHFSFYFWARVIFFFYTRFFFLPFTFCDGGERTYKCTFSRNLLGRRTTSIFIYTRATYDTLLSKKGSELSTVSEIVANIAFYSAGKLAGNKVSSKIDVYYATT